MLAGPNGAGKTTFVEQVLAPVTHLPFINADVIAAQRWPDEVVARSYDAAQVAAAERDQCIAARASFIAETVFSHPSKVELLRDAKSQHFLITLHVILIPVELSVARVRSRVQHGGHDVPEDKVRERFARLWTHVVEAIEIVDEARVYDNSRAATPYRRIATWRNGHAVGTAHWPPWTPAELREA